jgi:hypothetical protein
MFDGNNDSDDKTSQFISPKVWESVTRKIRDRYQLNESVTHEMRLDLVLLLARQNGWTTFKELKNQYLQASIKDPESLFYNHKDHLKSITLNSIQQKFSNGVGKDDKGRLLIEKEEKTSKIRLNRMVATNLLALELGYANVLHMKGSATHPNPVLPNTDEEAADKIKQWLNKKFADQFDFDKDAFTINTKNMLQIVRALYHCDVDPDSGCWRNNEKVPIEESKTGSSTTLKDANGEDILLWHWDYQSVYKESKYDSVMLWRADYILNRSDWSDERKQLEMFSHQYPPTSPTLQYVPISTRLPQFFIARHHPSLCENIHSENVHNACCRPSHLCYGDPEINSKDLTYRLDIQRNKASANISLS